MVIDRYVAGRRRTRYPVPEVLSDHLSNVIRYLGINCVLDVGAHLGEYVRLLRHDVGYAGPIISFEPVTRNYRLLSAAWDTDPQWRGFRFALGDTDRTEKINIYRASNLSSFLHSSQYGRERFPDMNDPPEREVVEVRRLDGLFDSLGLSDPPRILLKIDTQGTDTQVLAGARKTLEYVVSLQTEVPAQRIYEGMPTLWQALRTVLDLGFEISGMFPITRDDDDLRVVEFDCVAIRPECDPDRRDGRLIVNS